MLSIPVDDVQDLCDLVLAYHWPSGEWGKIGFVNHLVCAMIPQTSYHLDNIDTILPIPDNIDSMEYSLDSPSLISTSTLEISAFNSSRELGHFNGERMPASITTGDIPFVPGKKALLRAARPMFEGSVNGLTTTPYVHDRLQDTPIPKATSPVNRNGLCPMRASGRYHRLKVDTALGGDWEHALGFDDVVTSEMAK